MNNSDELKGASAAPASAGLTVGENVLQALGLSGQEVTSVTLEMTAAGEASLCVRLVARGPVLAALGADLSDLPLVVKAREAKAELDRARAISGLLRKARSIASQEPPAAAGKHR